jgi:hypothetical protein
VGGHPLPGPHRSPGETVPPDGDAGLTPGHPHEGGDP